MCQRRQDEVPSTRMNTHHRHVPLETKWRYICKLFGTSSLKERAMSHGEWKKQILLSYGTINRDATMEHETQRQRSNSYAHNRGSGAVCGSTPIVTLCNSLGTAGGGVLCRSVRKLYRENRNTSQSF
jgi:hypothetical protein